MRWWLACWSLDQQSFCWINGKTKQYQIAMCLRILFCKAWLCSWACFFAGFSSSSKRWFARALIRRKGMMKKGSRLIHFGSLFLHHSTLFLRFWCIWLWLWCQLQCLLWWEECLLSLLLCFPWSFLDGSSIDIIGHQFFLSLSEYSSSVTSQLTQIHLTNSRKELWESVWFYLHKYLEDCSQSLKRK